MMVEKVLQLFVITYSDYIDFLQGKYRNYKESIGGVIFFDSDFQSEEDLRDKIHAIHKKTPNAFIAVDEEGGRVSRVINKLKMMDVGAPFEYRKNGKKKAFDNAYAIASALVNIGFNLDFAPVADVWSNKENSVIGDRAYSDDYHAASELVAAAVRGFKQGGVLCTLKHFPGHGNTMADSHVSKAYNDKNFSMLIEEELIPFVEGIRAGADCVMTGHISTEYDPLPASLSKKWIDYLRMVMRFEGIIITDSMCMKGVKVYDDNEVALRALLAGNDMVLMPVDLIESVGVILEAVEEGVITEEMINDKVDRINRVKERLDSSVYGS